MASLAQMVSELERKLEVKYQNGRRAPDWVVEDILAWAHEIVVEELDAWLSDSQYRTRDIVNTISTELKRGGKGRLYMNVPYAHFVEFGTGIVGKDHPLGVDRDLNEHGWAGWTYYNDRIGGFMHTRGQGSKPYLYNTARRVMMNFHQLVDVKFVYNDGGERINV